MGGLGLKDLRKQGVALAVKWIAKATLGEEPWKILVRNNLTNGHPCGAKFQNNWDALDFLALDYKSTIEGYVVFKAIWKRWGIIIPLLGTINRTEQGNIWCGFCSIWWNLQSKGKPLALVQGCSTKCWSKAGINTFRDVFENNKLLEWAELKLRFNLPDSHRKTYIMINKALEAFGVRKTCC